MSSVVTNTILRLSTERLSELQELFNAKLDGLNEHEFVEAMGQVLDLKKEMDALLPDSRNSLRDDCEEVFSDGIMEMEEEDMKARQAKLDTVNVVAELCELFGQVDSCGEGTVKWQAFSYFLITMGATGGLRDMVFDDEFEKRCTYGARTSEDKYIVRAIRYCPVLQRVFVCVDDRVDVMDLYPSTSMKSSQPDPAVNTSQVSSEQRMLLQSIKISVPFKEAEKVTDTGMKLKEGPRESGPKIRLKCLDCVFIESKNYELFHGETVKPLERACDLRPSPSSPPKSFRALVVLSSDCSLSFFRFGRLNQWGLYEVVPAGRCDLPLQQLRLEWCGAASSLFSCGFDGEVRCWKVHYHGVASISLTGGASAERAKLLEGTFTLDQLKEPQGKGLMDGSGFKAQTVAKSYQFSNGAHTDVVCCFTLCSHGTNKETGESDVLLLASGGLDHKIIIWDPLTLTYQYELKPRHAAGVTSLSWDAHQGMLLSSSFDTTVQGFVLISSRLFPFFKLTLGHAYPVVSVSCAVGGCRAVSVDTCGGVRWWDTRRESMLEDSERLLCKASTDETSGGAVAVFGNDAATQYSANGISLVVMGRRLQIFDSIDVSAVNPYPRSLVFGGASLTLATTHGVKVAVWDAVTGDLLRMLEMKGQEENMGLQQHGDAELTCIALDGNDAIGDRRLVCGNMGGSIMVVDYLTGFILAYLPPHTGQVTSLITTESGLAVSTSTEGDLRVYDVRATGRPNVTTAELLLRVVKNCHGMGPVSSLAVSESLNLCCTGAGSSLRIWDFEFVSLEAQFPGATMPDQMSSSMNEGPSILSIAFLEPYPIVVCGDSSGYLTAFSLNKPNITSLDETQSSGYRRLIRWKNYKKGIFKTEDEDDGERHVTALEVIYETREVKEGKTGKVTTNHHLSLYASDKRGTLVAHDMMPLINYLGMQPIDATKTSQVGHQIRRKVSKDMKETVKHEESGKHRQSSPLTAKDYSHIKDIDYGKDDGLDGIYLPLVIDDWMAHDETVATMLTVKRPFNMLLSASTDGHVKLWQPRPSTTEDDEADEAYKKAVEKVMIPAINLKKKRRHSLPPPPRPTQHTLLGILTKGAEDRQLLLRESEMFRAADEKHNDPNDIDNGVPAQRSGRAACGMPPWRFPPSEILEIRAKNIATNTLVQGREARRRLEAMMYAKEQAENQNMNVISSEGVKANITDKRLGAAASTLSHDPIRQDQVTRLLGQFFFSDKSWKKSKFEIAKEEAERQVAVQKSEKRNHRSSEPRIRSEVSIGKDADMFLHPRYDASTLELIDDARKDREKAVKNKLLAAIAHKPGSSVAMDKKKAKAVLDLDPELTATKEKKHYPIYYSEVGRKGGYKNKSLIKSPEEIRELIKPSEFLLNALPDIHTSKKTAKKTSKRKSSSQQLKLTSDDSLIEITESSKEQNILQQMPSRSLQASLHASFQASIHSSTSSRPKVMNDQCVVAEQAEMHREWQSRVEAGLSVELPSNKIGLISEENDAIHNGSFFFGPYERDRVSLLYKACGYAYEYNSSVEGSPPPLKGSLLDLKRVQDEIIKYAQEERGEGIGDWLSIIAKLQQRYLGKVKEGVELKYDQVKVTMDEVMRAIFPLMRSYETQDAIDQLSKEWKVEPVIHQLTDEELVEEMSPQVVASLRRLFELFDIRNVGYVSSLEISSALRSSTPTISGSFDISAIVASGEIERLAFYFEGGVVNDSITSDGGSVGIEGDDAPALFQDSVGSLDEGSVGDEVGAEVKRKNDMTRRRKLVDRKVSQVEFILAFRDAL